MGVRSRPAETPLEMLRRPLVVPEWAGSEAMRTDGAEGPKGSDEAKGLELSPVAMPMGLKLGASSGVAFLLGRRCVVDIAGAAGAGSAFAVVDVMWMRSGGEGGGVGWGGSARNDSLGVWS